MSPENAFTTGARVHVRNAMIVCDRYGKFITGEIAPGSHEDYRVGMPMISSYINREIDPGVFLIKTGFTWFVDTWAEHDVTADEGVGGC